MTAHVAPLVLGIESMRSVWQALVDGVIVGSGYALVGLAFSLIFGVTKRFHFAFGLCYTVCAYVAAVVMESWGIPFALAAAIGLAIGVALACAIEVVAYRPIASRGGDNSLLGIFVAGMGLAIAGENLIRLIWGNNARVVSGTPGHSFSLGGGVDITSIEIVQVGTAVSIILGTSFVLAHTLFGQRIKAVRANPDMAEAIGVDVKRVFVLVFALGTAIAGVAALFEAMRFSVTAEMGNTPTFYAFVVAFVAGVHRSPIMVGMVGVGFGLVAKLSTLWVSDNFSAVAVFGLLFVWLTARVFPRAVRQLSGALRSTRASSPPNSLTPKVEV